MDKTNYDVFISFKNSDANGQDTVDKEVARKVYEFLKAKNLKVFFSPVTLEELGRDSWLEEINTALQKAKVFVALSSSKVYMEEKYPQQERTTFLTLKMNDPTRAIYSYIVAPMSTADLPDDVRKVECFQDRKDDALDRLHRFTANHIGRHAPQSDFKALAEKSNFSKEVFESLDRTPLLLFSTDSYNHTAYIAHIKEEACERFGKEHLLEINCGKFSGLKDSDKFYSKLAKSLGLGKNIEDSIDFEEALLGYFEKNIVGKTFILIVGIERLKEEVRNSFAESLRSLQEQHWQLFNLVLFGGEKLITLKYSTGKHSYFNTFSQKLIPAPSLDDWKANFSYLSKESYAEVVSVTGGYQKLTEYCFENEICTVKDAKKLIYESYFKSEVFRTYNDEEAFCALLKKQTLGDAHPYCEDAFLYRLYWDSLIVEEKGVFVWRSSFLKELGKDMLGCTS